MAKYADYSGWRPTVEQIKALGVEGVCRYISDRNLSDTSVPAKNITPDEAKTLIEGGLSIVLVWETGASRAGAGAAAGLEDVLAAEAQADYLGYPAAAPIFYAVDFDATVAQVKPYLDAIVANAKRTAGLGVYGGFDIIEAYVAPGKFTYGWQTRAWSEGKISTKANLYQNVFETNYDLNDVKVPILTAWKKEVAPPPPPPVPVPIAEAKAPARGDRLIRTTLDGYRTTTRTAAMHKEARLLYRLRGHGAYPKITQGGYNAGGVGASAGTHDRDAADDKLSVLTSSTKKLAWERVNWEVGFAGWRRPYIAGLWGEHFHKLPKGGDLSSAAKAQITQWNQGDDALRSDRDYPRILSSGLVKRTWEQYLELRPRGNASLQNLIAAFQSGKNDPTNDVEQVQKALNHFLAIKLTVDGTPGPVTKDAYATYQARQYSVVKGSADANGTPGADSLARLGFTVWE